MRKNSTPLKRRAFFARLLTNLTFHKKSFYSRRETTPKSKLVGTLSIATLERSLSVSLKLHQRAPTQQTKQEIIKFSEAILQELDNHPFEIELKTSAKFSSFLLDMLPFFVLFLLAGSLFLVIAQISSVKMAILFIFYIPPFISILTSRGNTYYIYSTCKLWKF
jgi:hypothetical protein